MSIVKAFGAAAILAVLCAPTASIATGLRGEVARPSVHAASGGGHVGYFHHRRPRQYFPHKKKKGRMGF